MPVVFCVCSTEVIVTGGICGSGEAEEARTGVEVASDRGRGGSTAVKRGRGRPGVSCVLGHDVHGGDAAQRAVDEGHGTKSGAGIDNYRSVTKEKSNDWQELLDCDKSEDIEIDDEADQYEEYDLMELLPTSLAEVEAIRNMRFEPSVSIDALPELYQHGDGSNVTYLRPEYKHIFGLSASSLAKPFTMDELMKFLSITFFIALNVKDEYANYWGSQPEDNIFSGSTTSLDSVLTLNPCKLLQSCPSFNVSPRTMAKDAAALIRPLLNLLKMTGDKYIAVRRNVALDEASVACRSRQGRHMIVFNPTKPTGKYHFRLYMVCCSSFRVSQNYRLHCKCSDITDRLKGDFGTEQVQALGEELEEVSKIRHFVLEVMRSLFGTNRIVNMDNYYASVQRSMITASWCDGNIVNMVSNADPSTVAAVTRTVGSQAQEYAAPTCAKALSQSITASVERQVPATAFLVLQWSTKATVFTASAPSSRPALRTTSAPVIELTISGIWTSRPRSPTPLLELRALHRRHVQDGASPVHAMFTQCLIVMVKDPGVDVYVPAMYVLLDSKQQDVYWNAFNYVIIQTGRLLEPAIVTCDFERGLMNAVTDQFPLVKIVGCLFHWKQVLRRKMIELRIPQDQIAAALTPGVLDILTIIPVDQIADKVPTSGMSKGMTTAGVDLQNRTNNPLESYNRAFGDRFSVKHPSLLSFVETAKEEATRFVQLIDDVKQNRRDPPRHAQSVEPRVPNNFDQFE
ncbi:unnamed protein product [Phytophthora fragariaefolia]|uniref:Unnamed protein product n=1 Tax=Phytophthora fragariaefolia TaxID=1490495 RepID=A0A9W7D2R8_9STRA|nr:unnamed protein product [Phytophthora fragariaefolia]